jgi:Na+-transporting NADH:ubiquinone oxidoreductase subunit F
MDSIGMIHSIILPVIQSVVFLMASGCIFALLLVIAEKKIVTYGPCEIDINSGQKKVTVTGGNSLLSSLGEEGIYIPSACGGRGTCAYCKVKVPEGGGSIGPVEEPYLSPDEIMANVRLSCQVKVRNAIKIEVPRELFSIRMFKAVLERKRPLTHDMVELRIKLENPASIDFVAGQYVQLHTPVYKGRESVMRAYSVSSSPSEKDHIELVIRKVPDGICTTWVFDFLKEGQPIDLSGPYGEFRLSNTDAPIIFIAGGSGMAPIYSILRRMRETANVRQATYFFGALRQQDLFYMEELRGIEKELASFTYLPALSNEPPDSDWKGERGLITQVMQRHIPDPSKYEAYLCGSPGMIDASIKILVDGGVPKEKIFYDKFS